MEATEILAKSVDKSQVPPLHQKRILAFVNHFLVSSCAFLNDFGQKCEHRFIDLERKLQKVESSLVIIESKLSSIPNSDNSTTTTTTTEEGNTATSAATPSAEQQKQEQSVTAITESVGNENEESIPTTPSPTQGVLACNDVRYKKFFKMVHFGVPAEAVKMKMLSEGLDATILDTPNAVLADGSSC